MKYVCVLPTMLLTSEDVRTCQTCK